jgi:hypothetical protein
MYYLLLNYRLSILRLIISSKRGIASVTQKLRRGRTRRCILDGGEVRFCLAEPWEFVEVQDQSAEGLLLWRALSTAMERIQLKAREVFDDLTPMR